MDINILRQIAVVLGALAFLGVCWWAFSPKRKKRFEEDAKLPFADEEQSDRSAWHADKKSDDRTPEERDASSVSSAPSTKQKEPSAENREPSAENRKPSAEDRKPSVAKSKRQDEQ